MKITLYIVFSLLVSFAIGSIHRQEIKPDPITLNFKPAFNVAVGPANIVAAYPVAGIDFTLNHAAGRLYIGTETGLRIEDADVFRLDSVTWTAVMPGGDWVTVNAETGQTEQYLDGEYRCFIQEISKP
ncbi:MAG: hypothetical protein IPK76_23055 [Lewinellaceae bacterium]|nr:hypothetical protein [Lewinellaceae bacterium]